jgi:hypothetical protein
LVCAAAALLLAGSASVAQAQFGRNRSAPFSSYARYNIPYDGRFTLVRVYFDSYDGWSFDYPDMERNFTLILREITLLRPPLENSNVLRFDSPEIFNYPMVYVSEPGGWHPNRSEVEGLRKYMAKGGFVFFDDFHYDNEWSTFEYSFRQAVPEAVFYRLTNTAPIFDSFYRIENLALPYPNSDGRNLTAEFYAVYQDNDPNKRMLAIISYNSDLGDYMEWSGTGRNPINLANEAYKFGVNFVLYGMTR